jgi:hypothetical protein
MFASILLLLSLFLLNAEDNYFKWNKVSGKWEIQKDEQGPFLYEGRAKSIRWDSSEVINFNSIVTFNPLSDYSSIKYSIELIDPIQSPVETMLLLSLKDYRTFYAFKFVIDNHKDDELQFIGSKIKDPSLDKAVKKNFEITKIQKKKFSLEFGKCYSIEIRVNKNTAELFIDGKKELDAQTAEDMGKGRIGFSCRNAKIRVRSVKIYSSGAFGKGAAFSKGERVVFEDDFSVDSIKRWTVKATQVK